MSLPRLLPVLLFLVLSLPAPAEAVPKGDAAFRQGIQAFKREDYRQALEAFERAWRAGMRRPSLYYNLGVCHYKLGHLDRARSFFRSLTGTPGFRQLAWYNLGLVALKEGRKAEARRWLRKAAAGSNPRVAALARRTLHRLKPARPWRAGADLALGYDDNVLLRADDVPTRDGDNYLDLYLWGDYRPEPDTRVGAFFSRQDYLDVNAGDFQQLGVTAARTFRHAGWHLVPSLRLTTSRLGGVDYQDIVDFRFTARKRLDGRRRLVLRVRHSSIDSGDPVYDPFQGARQQLRADYHLPVQAGRLRLRYQLELNDRDDSPTASFSPTRHQFRARLRRRLGGDWRGEAELEYRRSNYPAVAGFSRQDDRWRLRLGARRRLDKDMMLVLRYTYTDNRSNQASRDYTRNELSAGVEWRW